MRGVRYGSMYKILGSAIIDECMSSCVPMEGGKYERTLIASGGKTILCNQILGHIREKGLWALQGKGMVEGMTDCTLDFYFCGHCIYGKKIE